MTDRSGAPAWSANAALADRIFPSAAVSGGGTPSNCGVARQRVAGGRGRVLARACSLRQVWKDQYVDASNPKLRNSPNHCAGTAVVASAAAQLQRNAMRGRARTHAAVAERAPVHTRIPGPAGCDSHAANAAAVELPTSSEKKT